MSTPNENSTAADLKERMLKTERDLEAVLKLAAFFQDDYTLKIFVISAFRQWRGGHLSSEEFLKRLRADDLADVLRYEKAPPLEGLAIVSRYRRDPSR